MPIKRVRTTVGGDRVQYEGETAAYTAGLKTAPVQVQDDGCKKLLSPHSPEYAWVPLSQILAATQEKYHISTLAVSEKVLVEITGGMYGLLQAGLLAQRDSHGYHETPMTVPDERPDNRL